MHPACTARLEHQSCGRCNRFIVTENVKTTDNNEKKTNRNLKQCLHMPPPADMVGSHPKGFLRHASTNSDHEHSQMLFAGTSADGNRTLDGQWAEAGPTSNPYKDRPQLHRHVAHLPASACTRCQKRRGRERGGDRVFASFFICG